MSKPRRLFHINGIDSGYGEERVVLELARGERVAGRIPKTSAGNTHTVISELTNVNHADELVAW